MEKIIEYYRLCAVTTGLASHWINDIIDEYKKAPLFTEADFEIFMKTRDGKYIPNETIIGGVETDAGNMIIVV